MNNLATVGHNLPPSPAESAKEAFTELGAWLQDHPAILNHDDAKAGAAYVERTRVTLKELETERTDKVAPINANLKSINDFYRKAREPLEKTLNELKRRLTAYAAEEEQKRIEAATKARIEAAAKEIEARKAEQAEQDAIACADVGECTDVAGAIEGADRAFADYQKTSRAAQVAERDVPVRLGSVMGGKSLSMRTTEVLTVADPVAAITAMGLTDRIEDALLASAREFRREFGDLPSGIKAEFKRSI